MHPAKGGAWNTLISAELGGLDRFAQSNGQSKMGMHPRYNYKKGGQKNGKRREHF